MKKCTDLVNYVGNRTHLKKWYVHVLNQLLTSHPVEQLPGNRNFMCILASYPGPIFIFHYGLLAITKELGNSLVKSNGIHFAIK